jgi:hypothetical protein
VRGLEERFGSRILPLFLRRTKEVGELLPELYLHGLAQGDFELALRGLLGDAAPLSLSSIARLRANWQLEYEAWCRRPLDEQEVVYLWADGLYVKAGLEREKAALLVVIGAFRVMSAWRDEGLFVYRSLNVIFQQSVLVLLLLQVGSHNVADRHDADELTVLEHRKVSDPVLSHDSHNVVEAVTRYADNQVHRHDVSHECRAGCSGPIQLYASFPAHSQDISFAHNPRGAAVSLGDDQGTDPVLVHPADGFLYGAISLDGHDVPALLSQDILDPHGRDSFQQASQRRWGSACEPVPPGQEADALPIV